MLLPWVLRDPKCRGQKLKGKAPIPDQWGSPTASGYLRDDNSLVKGLPKSLTIESKQNNFVHGRNLGNEFVASHIWRENKAGVLASRLPKLNTFVPNLVWLPSQVAKLSDREGGPIQTALKEISWSLYRNLPLSKEARVIAEDSWRLLSQPTGLLPTADDELNWFVTTPRFIKTRKSKLAEVVSALERLNEGNEPPHTLRPSRYREGLSSISKANRSELIRDLRIHLAGIEHRRIVVEIDHKSPQSPE